MEIVNFDEVEDSDMIELNLACFNHTYSKDHIKKMIRSDKRMPDWGGELYAKEKGKTLGCVGILFPRVKLSEETKKVGGIRNVCSRPSKSRRGVVKNLMERAHDTLRQEVELSFLMTPKSNVAYNLYKKLGYETVHVPPKAYKRAEEKETDIEFRDENDPEYIRSLYLESVKDLSGLVVREEDYWDMAEARGWPDNDNVKIAYKEGERIGYAIYESSRNSLSVKEFAGGKGNLVSLLRGLESASEKDYIVISYVNPSYRKLLEEAGYSWHQDLWYRVMCKDLRDETDEKIKTRDKKNFHTGIYETF
ncbi:MAG: GNAT family N-acetyltransferase [Candidatus Thermoplasmatota archaeon]|nr:GNAT family N-acetyltransferase [Candidatus Thermoplasmatota archaeon]